MTTTITTTGFVSLTGTAEVCGVITVAGCTYATSLLLLA